MVESGKGNILLVAADTPARLRLCSILAENKCQILPMADPEQALVKAGQLQPPTLLIVDQQVGAGEGLDFVRRVQKGGLNELYILLLTEDQGQVEQILDLGVNDYLVFPYAAEELRARVRVACRFLEMQVAMAAQLQAQQETSQRLKIILDSAQEGIVVYDRDLRYQIWNPFMERWSRIPASQVLGKHPLELFPFLGETGLIERLERALAGEKAETYDFSFTDRERGRQGWVSDESGPLYNEKGEIVGVIGMVRDVSKRKRTQIQLENQRALLDDIQRLSMVGGWQWDAIDQQMVWTEEMFHIHGLSPEEVESDGHVRQGMRCYTPRDRLKVRNAFRRCISQGIPYDLELPFTSKDGKRKWIRTTARAVWEDGRIVRAIGNVMDISEHKLHEDLLAARLRLSQASADLSISSFLQGVLDEAESLTGSCIGFFHFLEEDQQTLSLQTWSSNTLQKMCTAKAAGNHYPIAKAGVWVDCVRQRRPVIHNDYAALPHRKGLPTGHAPVIRQLVVPVFRGEAIVAIIGVGNKQTEYEQRDVEIIEKLADMTWDIVVRKHAEEAREQLLHDARKRVKELRCIYGISERAHRDGSLDEMFQEVVNDIPSGYQYPEITRVRITFNGRVFLSGNLPALPRWRQQADIMVDGKIMGSVEVFYLEECPRADEGPFLMEERQLLNGIAGVLGDAAKRDLSEKTGQRLISAIEQVGETIVITDSAGTIQYINPAFTRSSGYRSEELLGQDFSILQEGEGDAIINGQVWQGLRQGQSWDGRISNRHRDGTSFVEDITISPVIDRHGRVSNCIAVRRDVTEQVRLEEQHRQLQKVEAIGQLAGGVAHDLNNLLTPILGYAELLQETLGSKADSRPFVDEIVGAGKRARDLIRQLLAFGRKQDLKYEPLQLNSALQNFFELLRRTIREDIDLRLVLASDIQPIIADMGQVEQVVMNLAVNAQDAMPEGGLLLLETKMVEIDELYVAEHSGVTPGRYVMLAITDTGQGMDEDTCQHIFDPFFSTKGDQGTGLGLASVYGIVKQHRGNIWVYSELGKGTTFKVYFPISEQERTVTKAEKERGEMVTGNETILLVEDNDQVRTLADLILKRHGYCVLSAENGTQALQLLREGGKKVELLLTDVIMPDMNGREVFEQAVALCPDLRVLYMSGYTGNMVGECGILEEEAAFIQKPFNVAGLTEKVREVLG